MDEASIRQKSPVRLRRGCGDKRYARCQRARSSCIPPVGMPARRATIWVSTSSMPPWSRGWRCLSIGLVGRSPQRLDLNHGWGCRIGGARSAQPPRS